MSILAARTVSEDFELVGRFLHLFQLLQRRVLLLQSFIVGRSDFLKRFHRPVNRTGVLRRQRGRWSPRSGARSLNYDQRRRWLLCVRGVG